MSQFQSSNVQKFQDFSPEIGHHVFLHASATVIGHVNIGDDCSVWPGAVIRGDVNFIRIGQGTNIQDLSTLHVSHKSSEDPDGSPLIIGNHVTVGHNVILHGCTIEDECLIGMGSIIMDKTIVQKHVMVGAGSLVPEGKVLESGYLYIGRPARRIRPLTDEEITHFMYSANHYIKLKNQYLSNANV
jgi:carbonic anhydrase/acetyltransferase-like protein (isoleucine patch superfamily)